MSDISGTFENLSEIRWRSFAKVPGRGGVCAFDFFVEAAGSFEHHPKSDLTQTYADDGTTTRLQRDGQ